MPDLQDAWFTLDGPPSGSGLAPDLTKSLSLRCEQACGDRRSARGLGCLYASAYEGMSLGTFNVAGADLMSIPDFKLLSVPIIRNTLRACIQTILAKVFAPDAPKPFVIANGGDWDMQQKAEDANDFLVAEMALPQGQWDSFDDLANQAGLLAMVATGTAAIIINPGHEQVEAELDDTLNMGIDQSGKGGAVRGYVRKYWRDPEEMLARYTKKAEQDAIRSSIVECDDPLELAQVNPNRPLRKIRQVELHEGLRTRCYGIVGRHVIATKSGYVLKDDDYDFPDPNAVFLTWDRPISGFWGTPATQTALAEFLAQNRLLGDVDEVISNLPGALVIAPEASQSDLQKAKGIQRISSETPDKIRIEVLSKLDNSALAMADNHGQGVHSTLGISPGQTGGERTVGTRSGEHEELVAKLTSERFADNQRRIIEAKVRKPAKLFLRSARQMIDSGMCPDFVRQFVAKDGKTFREVKAADLDLDDSRYVTSIAPVSEDDRTPQQLAQKADELLKTGVLDGNGWWQAQQNANVSAAMRRFNSQIEWCDHQIRIWMHAPLEKLPELYNSPRKFQGLKALGEQVANAVQDAQIRNCPEERMVYFDRFLDETFALYQQEIAMQAQLTAGAPPAPQLPA